MPHVATIRRSVPVPLMLATGRSIEAHFVTFDGLSDGREHVALCFNPLDPAATPLVRLHSECLTGDVFASQRCDCGQQLDEAMDYMARNGGIILYLRQEGRGIGLYNKLDAYALQMQDKLDTFAANAALGHGLDERSYDVAAQMLGALGVNIVQLLSNNPDKRAQLEAHGIIVSDLIPTRVYLNTHNETYLEAKQRAGHKIKLHDRG